MRVRVPYRPNYVLGFFVGESLQLELSLGGFLCLLGNVLFH